MYTVDDKTFQRARSVISVIANELSEQRESGIHRPVDLQALVRRSSPDDLPADGEADYLASLATPLERSFPIGELFPHRRTRKSAMGVGSEDDA